MGHCAVSDPASPEPCPSCGVPGDLAAQLEALLGEYEDRARDSSMSAPGTYAEGYDWGVRDGIEAALHIIQGEDP